MATTIYFPSINAQATIDADLKRGSTASVCHGWQEEDGAYIGAIRRIRFTTVRPKNWDRIEEVAYLKHIPDGGFSYKIY